MRSLRRFPSHKLRAFKEKIFLHFDDHSVAALKSLKKHNQVCLYLLENPRKKEFVVSELARGRVNKFSTVG